MVGQYFAIFLNIPEYFLIQKYNREGYTAAFHVNDRSRAVYKPEFQTLQLRTANVNIFRGVVELIGNIARKAFIHHNLPNIIGFAPRPQAVVGAKIGAGQKKHTYPDDIDVVRQDLWKPIYERDANLTRTDHLKRVIRPFWVSTQQAHD